MNKIEKKKIVEKLNKLINNYQELSAFCNELSNDANLVIDNISRVIKYAFIREDFILYSNPLYALLSEIKNIDDLDEKYREIAKKKMFFSIARKNTQSNIFNLPLHDDIEISDITNLKLPSHADIEEICRENLRLEKIKLEQKQEQEILYKKEKVFEEIGLEYTRPELITIDNNFKYYGMNLSSNPNTDFKLLYSDERYNDTKEPSNPLNNDYHSNISKIKQSTDISITKLGNLNKIKNGRHRIVYILHNGKTETIPAKVTRRIEDKETNIILINLKKHFNISVCKNNILNDEPNILLFANNMLYEIKDKKSLIEFYNNVINKKTNEHFNPIKFNIVNNINRNQIINKYKEIIFKRYLNEGTKILTGNFTDAIKYFVGEANSLFYEAYNLMQYEYQNSIVHGYNFNELYENRFNIGIENNAISPNDTKKQIK